MYEQPEKMDPNIPKLVQQMIYYGNVTDITINYFLIVLFTVLILARNSCRSWSMPNISPSIISEDLFEEPTPTSRSRYQLNVNLRQSSILIISAVIIQLSFLIFMDVYGVSLIWCIEMGLILRFNLYSISISLQYWEPVTARSYGFGFILGLLAILHYFKEGAFFSDSV